jgi:hypothetical protein
LSGADHPHSWCGFWRREDWGDGLFSFSSNEKILKTGTMRWNSIVIAFPPYGAIANRRRGAAEFGLIQCCKSDRSLYFSAIRRGSA